MNRTTAILTLLVLIGAALMAVPGAEARDEKHCVESGFRQCDGPVEDVKDFIERSGLDPRDWPCTCPPSKPIS